MQISANGITLEAEVHGSASDEPVLLIMGLGMQLSAWPDELLQQLIERGMRPIVFDNRDIGLSTKFDHWGRPNLLGVSLQHMLRLPIRSPYKLSDMAGDAAGLLDALGIPSAHVVGVSMGGMIAQHLAAEHPARVKSLTLVMTSSGARGLPGPTARARRALLSRPRGRDLNTLVEHGVGVWKIIGSPGYPSDDAVLKAKVERSLKRSYHPAGMARQLVAVAASGDRSAFLGRVRQPVKVIHGRADPLVPLACGEDLASKIPCAELTVIDGMGHDLPAPLLGRLAGMVAGQAGR
ncbi:MAG: alpha/beta fold hydrolase [Burkholderiales bacterium]|nr:alpha/beta fold hydrolase [Burkholderiales bacterium]